MTWLAPCPTASLHLPGAKCSHCDCLGRLPTSSQTNKEAEGCGPLQQMLTNIYKLQVCCQIHCDRLSQAGKDLIKAESRTSKLLFILLWMSHTDCSCVCLGGCWVFWALLSPAGSAVFLARSGPFRNAEASVTSPLGRPVITILWVAGIGGHLRLLDFLFANHQ